MTWGAKELMAVIQPPPKVKDRNRPDNRDQEPQQRGEIQTELLMQAEAAKFIGSYVTAYQKRYGEKTTASIDRKNVRRD